MIAVERTILDVKADIDTAWLDLQTLEDERDAIKDSASITADLRLDFEKYEDMLRKDYYEKKQIYKTAMEPKELEIKVKQGEIKNLLTEFNQLALIEHDIQATKPEP